MSVAATSAAIGLTPATLRTWDRRYGMSPSVRTSGGHRRYNEHDLLRLRAVARLVDDGVPPAGATRAVIGWTIEQCKELLRPATPPAAPTINAVTNNNSTHPIRVGGGRTLSMANATSEQRGMARAAMALDGQTVRNIMTAAMNNRGAVRAWEELAAPVLIALGDRWSRVKSGVEIEHITSQGIAEALDVGAVADPIGRPVLLCCTPNDQHSLALLALRAALAEQQVTAIMLGTQLPQEALVAAAIRLRPRAIVLWASMEAHADLSVLQTVPEHRPPTRLFVAGPGWTGVDPTDGTAKMLPSLSSAVAELGR